MAFCKYCGSQLEEGQECSCEGAQAAKNAAVNPQPQAQETQAQEPQAQATQTQEQPQPQPQPQAQTVNVAPNQTAEAAKAVAINVGGQLLDVIKKFFTAPIELMEEAYTSTSQIAQYVILGIFVVFSLLFTSLYMSVADSPFLVGLAITASLVAIKFVFSVIAFLTKDTEGTFANAIGLFSITTIPGTIFVLLIFIFSKMSFVVGELSLLVIWLIVDSIYSYLAFNTMIKKSKTKALNVFIIIAVVVTFIAVAIGYNKVVELVTEMVQNAIYDSFDSLW